MKRWIALLSRYGLVSVICLAVNSAVMVASDYVGLPYGIGVLVSFALCVPIGYLLHTFYTYERHPQQRGLVHYTLAMAINLPIAFATIWLFYGQLHLPMTVAAPLSSIVGIAYNFISTRWTILGRPALLAGKAE